MGRWILQTWSRHLSDWWSTISSGKPCRSLCIPQNSLLIHKHRIPFPLSRYTRSCQRSDHQYLYIMFTLVTEKSIYSFSWHCILHDLVTCLQASQIQLSPSGPRVSICHTDRQILLLVHMPQHTPLAYPKDTFSVTRSRSGWLMESKQPLDVVDVTSQSKD
jgi:hypothetical protein